MIAEGTRELDVDIDAKTCDVTGPAHGWASTLALAKDITVKVLIYWQANYDSFASKFYGDELQPVELGITNVGTLKAIPVKVSIKQPIDGVMAWEVTFKNWAYD